MNKCPAHCNLSFVPAKCLYYLFQPVPGLLCLGFGYCLYEKPVQPFELRMVCGQGLLLLEPCVCFLSHLSGLIVPCFIPVIFAFSVFLGCKSLAAHSDANVILNGENLILICPDTMDLILSGYRTRI